MKTFLDLVQDRVGNVRLGSRGNALGSLNDGMYQLGPKISTTKYTHVYGDAAENALQPNQTEPSTAWRRPLELYFQVGHGVGNIVRLLARGRKVLVIVEESLADWKAKATLGIRNERQVLPNRGDLSAN